MEFNTEVAPYANLVAQPAMVIVDVQPASMPLDNTLSPVCVKNPVKHEIYQLFLSAQDFNMDSYFSGIESMLTVRNILENGVKVLEVSLLQGFITPVDKKNEFVFRHMRYRREPW